jgi:hypothetical protein
LIMERAAVRRVPLEILNKTTGLDEQEWRIMQGHPWLGALTLFSMRTHEEVPYRSVLVAHEHHMKTDLTGYPKCLRPRALGLFSRIVSVADGFDAATTRRCYQTIPIEPDQVLRDVRIPSGLRGGVVKALINLIGVTRSAPASSSIPSRSPSWRPNPRAAQLAAGPHRRGRQRGHGAAAAGRAGGVSPSRTRPAPIGGRS